MKIRYMITVAAAVVSLGCVFGREVPVIDGTLAEFLSLTPQERRVKFTDEAWRKQLTKEYGKMKWREGAEGEFSRWCRMTGVRNVRDVGGLAGLGGKRVKSGRIYRSAQLNKAAPYKEVKDERGKKRREYYGSAQATLKAGEAEAIQKEYAIKTDLDLRAEGQCLGMKNSPLGEGVNFINISFSNYSGIYKGEGAAAMGKALRVFLDERNYPVIFHCVKGADRTGSLAFILQALLGVSAEDRLLDWELTAYFNNNVKFAHEKRYDELVKGLEKYPGANDVEKSENYVKSLGLTDEDIAKLRSIMLEK